MLKLQDVHISYAKHEVINNITASFIKQHIYGIVGLNGAGKTTLLRAIIGLKSLTSGSVTWNDSPVTPNLISYLETEPYFYPMLTGREHLEFFRLQNPGFNVNEWNSVFELPLDKRIDQYSKGMQKKLQIFTLLILDRPIMLLDEPFNNLDIETNQLLEVIFNRLKENGKIIIMTSHIIDPLLRICQTISILREGHFIWTKGSDSFDKISDLLNTESVKMKREFINNEFQASK